MNDINQTDHQSLLSVTQFPLLSFFTGAGLLDIGFVDAGFRVVWHNECETAFADGFEFAMNSLYGSSKPVETTQVQNRMPLQHVKMKTIEIEAFGESTKPVNFGIIGSPPCPDFSTAGRHKGKNGPNGFLTGTYVNHILSLQPTFFVLENVPGLLRTAKHKAYLEELLQLLEHDFALDATILNALDFGVPQDRYRVIVLGFRRDWLETIYGLRVPLRGDKWAAVLDRVKLKLFRGPRQIAISENDHWFPWPHGRYAGAKWDYNWPKTSPLGGDPKKPASIPEVLMVGAHIGEPSELTTLPNGCDSFKPYSSKFDIVDEGDVSGKSFKRLHRWRYSPTAAYGNREVHLHPFQRRRLTVREAMRIQSVPDTYALPPMMTLSDKFRTISNGVPVKLANALAERIAGFVSGYWSPVTNQ